MKCKYCNFSMGLVMLLLLAGTMPAMAASAKIAVYSDYKSISDTSNDGLSAYADALRAQGYTVEQIYDPITSSKLDGCEALLMTGLGRYLPSSEKSAIEDFVENQDKGLLLSGGSSGAVNDLSQNFTGGSEWFGSNIVCDPTDYEVYSKWVKIQTFYDHPITENLGRIVMYKGTNVPAAWFYSGIIGCAYSDDDSWLDEDWDYVYDSGESRGAQPVLAHSSWDKIVIVPDGNVFDNSDAEGDGVVAFCEYDNDVLGLNVARWLAGAEEGEIKFAGTAIEYDDNGGMPGSSWGWTVSVDEMISGPQPCSNQLDVTLVAVFSPCGYMDPNIVEGDKIEVYGDYYEDQSGCGVSLIGSEDYYIKKADDCDSLVKFKGTATTDEGYGEFVCYGSYYCTVKVEEILQDPDNTLMSGYEYQVCYGATQKNIKTGDKLEVFGDYYPTCGPLQCVGNIVASGDDYYVKIIVEEAVNFIGVVENEPSEPYDIGVRIDEIILDPEGKLSPGDLANIDIADDPTECDVVWPVHKGDRVEVFAKHYDYDCWLPSYDICVWIYSKDSAYDGYLKLLEEERVHNINTGKSFSKIQYAIDDSGTGYGHTITVDPGTYPENVNIYKSLTIKSTSGSPEDTVVQAANSMDHVFEVMVDYVNISGFTVMGPTSYSGIYLGTSCCEISNNSISNDVAMGIHLSDSSNNKIENNSIRSSKQYGIGLYGSSNNNINDNNISNSGFTGIYLSNSCSNSIENNDAHSSTDFGIRLWSSSNNNNIRNNNLSDNHGGICLWSSNNNITYNDIYSNSEYGIWLSDSSNNKIYLNNFKKNSDNVCSSDSTNIWNSTKKITYTYNDNTFTRYIGNYWDDYEEKYPDAEEIEGAGIWDNPYSIDGDEDNYPLVERFENYIKTEGLPDLLITNSYWIPDEPALQEPVTFYIVVKNEGQLTCTSFDVKLALGQVFELTKRVDGLNSGNSATLCFYYDPNGDKISRGIVEARVDSSSEITETDENNNFKERILADCIGKIAKRVENGENLEGETFYVYGLCNYHYPHGFFHIVSNLPEEQKYRDEGYYPGIYVCKVGTTSIPEEGELVIYKANFHHGGVVGEYLSPFAIGGSFQPKDFMSLKYVDINHPTGVFSTEGVVIDNQKTNGFNFAKLAVGTPKNIYSVWIKTSMDEKHPVKGSLVFVKGELEWSNTINAYCIEPNEIQMIWGFYDKTVLTISCPVNTTITDQYSRIIADKGTNEIPGADIITMNDTKIFYLPTDLTYTTEIDAYDIGTFNFTRISPSGADISVTKFENIPITASTKAFVEIVPDVTNYTMRIDYGNGTIEERYPDVNETIEVEQNSYTIPLHTGWNLISTPLVPADTGAASVLSPISGNYSIIWEYNASDTADHWKKYDPSAPFGNDLTDMEPGKGYWILMTSDDTLPITGTVPESTDISLTTGWNLIGHDSLDSQPIADALSSISDNYDIVWGYDASDTADHWKKYDPSAPFGNDLTDMEPGKGYWILVSPMTY